MFLISLPPGIKLVDIKWHFYFKEFRFSAKYLPSCMNTDEVQSLALILKYVVKITNFNVIEQNTEIRFQDGISN